MNVCYKKTKLHGSPNLLKELCCHPIGAVKDDEKLLVLLQFLQEWSGVLVTWCELPDLDLQVKLCRSLDQFLHPHQT